MTKVRAIRDGRPCQLVQRKSASGLPCCVNCLKVIPKSYRESWESYRVLFCTNGCAIKWAVWAADQIYPKGEE